MLMQVKKATFQRMEVLERVELKIDGIYHVHDSLHHRKCIFPRKVHREESAADRQSEDRSVPGDTAECCSVSDISIQCYSTRSRTYTSNPSRGVNTNCHSYLPFSSSSYCLLGSYAVSAELQGVTLTDRNLSADHLEQIHTHRFDQHLYEWRTQEFCSGGWGGFNKFS